MAQRAVLATNVGTTISILAGLPRSYCIEQLNNNERDLPSPPLGDAQELVEQFGARIAAAADRPGTQDKIRFFIRGELVILVIDLGRGRKHHTLALAGRGAKHDFGSVNIGFNGANGTFDDQPDADGSREMHNKIALVHELGDQLRIKDATELKTEVLIGAQCRDIRHRTGR